MPLASGPLDRGLFGMGCAAVVWLPVEAWGEGVQGVGLILARGEVCAGERAQAWSPGKRRCCLGPWYPTFLCGWDRSWGFSHPLILGGRVQARVGVRPGGRRWAGDGKRLQFLRLAPGKFL